MSDSLESLRQAFLSPADAFSPIPFWFWNGDLTMDELKRQIHDFKDKGVAGFVIHPRMGLSREIPYLSAEYFSFVRFAVEEAASLGMKVVLYDEGMYPSGSAHGQVVQGNPEYASRGLLMLEFPWQEGFTELPLKLEPSQKPVSVLAVKKTGSGSYIRESVIKGSFAKDKISFSDPESHFPEMETALAQTSEGWTILIFLECPSGGTIRGVHFGEDDGEPYAPPSADLLNPDAMEKYIRLTHDRYFEELRTYFGTTVIAMFTDEPCILGRGHKKGMLPWTWNYMDCFLEQGLKETDLPSLFLDGGPDTGKIRESFHHGINQRLSLTYYQPLSRWCQEHGIALTGHPEKSDDIGFLKFFHIPGQDIVWRWVAPEDGKGLTGPHSTMAKCASDAARHAGRLRNANECFGCCGPQGDHWAFSADDMKWYMDWLFVRGTNLLFPHAFYYSLEGERRQGERPPDVGLNNLWWKDYAYIATYVKRLCWLLTGSVNRASLAVLCSEDHLPWRICKPLFENQIEFNYLERDLLFSEACRVEDGKLLIANQAYSLLLVEDLGLLPSDPNRKLEAFTQGGGRVLSFPIHSEREEAQQCELIEILRNSLMEEPLFLPSHKGLRISRGYKGDMPYYLLTNEGEEAVDGILHVMDKGGKAELWKAWEGTCTPLAASASQLRTQAYAIGLKRRESAILILSPRARSEDLPQEPSNPLTEKVLPSSEIILKEPWTLRGLPSPAPEALALRQGLTCWTSWENMDNFSGTLTYETTFHLDAPLPFTRVLLSLGRVCEMARVNVNGTDLAPCLWAPYEWEVTHLLREGQNLLAVEVTNSISNRLSKSKRPSGLFGPVSLKFN